MLRHLFFSVIWFSSFFCLYAQKDFSSCSGHVSISPNVSYDLKFPGKFSKDKSGVTHYCELPVVSNNFIWLQYKPQHKGTVQFYSHTTADSIILFVFETQSMEDCAAILSKKARLVSCEQRTMGDSVFQKYEVKDNFNYFYAINAAKGKTNGIKVRLDYVPLTEDGKVLKDSLMFNAAYHRDQPIYGIHFRDEITGFPVVARLYLYASSMIDGTYRGSEILVNNQKKLKALIKIDAEGYYSKDFTDYLITPVTHHDTIKLTPISRGTITKLDEIYFAGGLAVIMEESMPRLKRLKDFLLLNPSISIEVQGHVNEDGKHSFGAQRLSKKRARKIVEYLIECGISSERLDYVGFGNSHPMFPNPENDEQREANRRVEIKIK